MNFAVYLALGTLQSAADPAPTMQTRMDQLATAAVRCEVSGVFYTQFTDEPRLVRVLVPKEVWSKRKENHIRERLGCIKLVAVEQGYRPILLGMRR